MSGFCPIIKYITTKNLSKFTWFYFLIPYLFHLPEMFLQVRIRHWSSMPRFSWTVISWFGGARSDGDWFRILTSGRSRRSWSQSRMAVCRSDRSWDGSSSVLWYLGLHSTHCLFYGCCREKESNVFTSVLSTSGV